MLNHTFGSEEEESIYASCLVYLTSTFAEDPTTVQLSLSAMPELLNDYVHSILQTNDVGGSNIYAANGLLGDGQIVSVADTGVDETSCYFQDPNGQVQRSPLSQPITNPSIRKVAISFLLNPFNIYCTHDEIKIFVDYTILWVSWK